MSLFKMVAEEIFMCGLKKVPLVGDAVDVVEGVNQKYKLLAHENKLKELENEMTGFDKRVRDVVSSEMESILSNLQMPSLNDALLHEQIENLKAIKSHGYSPVLFEGILKNSLHWEGLRKSPQNYGTVLSDSEKLDGEQIQGYDDHSDEK